MVILRFTFQLLRPLHNRRRSRDLCPCLQAWDAPLRQVIPRLALWPTCITAQVMSPSMTSTTTRRSRRKSSPTLMTTNPISPWISSQRASRQNLVASKRQHQQQDFFFRHVSVLTPAPENRDREREKKRQSMFCK